RRPAGHLPTQCLGQGTRAGRVPGRAAGQGRLASLAGRDARAALHQRRVRRPGAPGGPRVSPVHPLVDEAMKKAAIAWLSVETGRTDEGRLPRASGPTGRPYPVWCLWVDVALYLVSGPGE